MANDIGGALITEPEIKKRMTEMVLQIYGDCKGKELIVIGILKGSFMFMADLLMISFLFIAKKDLTKTWGFCILSCFYATSDLKNIERHHGKRYRWGINYRTGDQKADDRDGAADLRGLQG